MRFPHPFEGVRPPTDYWVDRPEVYSSNAQPTGTNRPNTCHTNPQHNQQTSWPQGQRESATNTRVHKILTHPPHLVRPPRAATTTGIGGSTRNQHNTCVPRV